MALFNILLLTLFATAAVSKPIKQIKHSNNHSNNELFNKPPAIDYGAAADDAFDIFMSSMYNEQLGMLRASVNSDNPSEYWNTAVAFQSLLNYHNLKSNQSNKESIKKDNVVIPLIYTLIESEVTTGVALKQCDSRLRNNYNDDMSWMIHGLTALYDVTSNKSLIDRSLDLHLFIRQSEDTTCCGDMKGGIWWDLFHTQKATAAQAGAALTGLRLMESNSDKFTKEEWIDWSITHYDFWLSHMVNQSDYAVCDNINTAGDRRWWSFTYNEGLMLGVAVHLYRATNDSRFLIDANGFMQRLIDTSISVKVNGRQGQVLASDGEQCSGDTSQFKQVAFQYATQFYRLLLDLNDQSFDLIKPAVLYQFLQDNIDSLLTNAYNSKTKTWNCDWSRAYDGSIKGNIDGLQGTMNGALSSIALFAGLPTPPNTEYLSQ